MKIENIFGLHLGCKCKNDTDEFTVIGIRPDTTEGCESIYIQGEYNDLYNIKYCKLLLKPLSAISEEDKAEILNGMTGMKGISHLGLSDGGVFVTFIDSTGNKAYHHCNILESLWLAQKGYNIGIVPPEYMEIVND